MSVKEQLALKYGTPQKLDYSSVDSYKSSMQAAVKEAVGASPYREQYKYFEEQYDLFNSEFRDFVISVEKDNSGSNQFNAAEYFENRKKQADALKQKAADLSSYLDEYSTLYTPEYYDALKNILSTFDTNVDDVLSLYQPSLDSKAGMAAYEDEYFAAMERNEQLRKNQQAATFGVDPMYQNLGVFDSIFRQSTDNSKQAVTDDWTAEQRYNLGNYQNTDPAMARQYAQLVNTGKDPFTVAAQQEAEKAAMLAMDLEAERREIDQLKADLEDYSWNTDYDATSSSERKAFDAEIKRREKEISDREQQYNLAKRVQESEQFKSAADRSDFAAKSGYVDSGFTMPAFAEDADPDELVYEYINNQNGVRSKVDGESIALATKGYDLLNEDEVALYNYYYATEGPVKAQQYLDNIQETLNYRMGERIAQSKSGDFWKQYLSAAVTGYSGAVSGLQNLFNGDEYIPTSAFQQASGMIREDLADVGKLPEFYGDASLGQIGYDLISTTANMAPSIMLSTAAGAINPVLGKVVGAASMGASAAGNSYQQALNNGYTKEQARTYAALTGASEVALEYVLGGISKLGGEIPQRVLSNMVKGVDNAVARAAITLGGSMASEGFEEGLQEVITPWIENLTLYADKDVNWDEVAYSTLLGALSGGFMEGPGVVANTSNVSKIDKQLKNLGAKGNTLDLAELIVRHRSGEQLSQEEYIKLATSDQAMQVLTGVQAADSENEGESVEQGSPVATPRVSQDGRAIQISTNEAIDTLDFASVNNGKATIQLKSGDTAEYSDVSFASEKEANQFYAVASLPGIDTENANNLLHTIQEADAGKDVDSVVGIREAYGMGYFGMQESDLESGDAANLSPELRKAVFDIGRQQRAADSMVKAAAKPVTAKPSAGYKKVVFEGKTRQITKKQKAEIEFVDYIAENFSGNTVHVYESYKGYDGKYYYRDNSGKRHRAPNGKYVNGEIWLDLKAGDNQEGLMLNTFSHEMYHHIEKFDKTKAQELAEFVVKELGKKSVDDAVAEQIKKARKAGLGESYFERQGMTKEQARNEVYMRAMSDFVADSLETMFTRGDPAKAIANLKKENRTLFDEIKAFIDKWVSKIKEFYSDKTISKEGEMVAQLEKFEQLQQLFMEAVQSAGENYRAALINADKKSTTKEGDAKFSNRRDNVQADITSKYQKTVDQILSLQNTKQDHVLIGYTPKIYEELGMPSLPFVIGTGHIYSAAKTEAEAKLEGNYRKGVNYHGLGGSVVKNIYEKLNDPVMIIASKDVNKNATPMRSTHSVVAIVDVGNAQKSLLLPVEITAERTVDGVRMDVNALSSIYEKTVSNLVNEAIAVENTGDVGIFYAKKEALTLPGAGVQFPVLLQQSIASNSIVHRFSEKVNMNILDATQSQQFKRWFGDWQNDPQNASKVVNTDGTPKVMYHGSPAQFSKFDRKKAKSSGLYGRGFYFTDSDTHAKTYGNTYSVYLNIRNPLQSAKTTASKDQVRGFLEAVAENEDYSIENYGTYYIDSILKTVMDGKSKVDAFKVIQDISATAIGDMVEATELFNSVNGTDFDGIIVPTETVAFRPEQIKSATDNVGTFDVKDSDIYHSLRNEKTSKKESGKSYKAEQKNLIQQMQTEQRLIREELTGKESDISIMEKEFIRLAKKYEQLDTRTGKKSIKDAKTIAQLKADLKEEAKSHREDSKIWEREFNRLMRDYETSGRQIARLEATISRQRATAKARVEGRRKTEMRHKIQRKANELDQLLRHGTKHRNVPEFLQNSVAAVLQAINMEVRDGEQRRKTYEANIARYDRQIAAATDPATVSRLIEKRNEYAAKGDQFANRMDTLQKAYEQIRKENTGLELDEGIAEHLNSLFETVGDTPLGQMTEQQLDAVNDILNVTMTTVRNANEMLAEERSAGVVETSKSAIMEIKSAGETKKKKTPIRKKLEQFGWNNLKPIYAFDVIGSKTLKARYEALRKGEDTLAVDLNEAKEFFQEQWKKNGGKEWDMEQKWKFTSTSGKSFELDLNQIMTLYAMAKDEDARSHLRVGGFVFDSDYQTKEDINLGPVKIPVKVESTDASAYNLSDEILGEIISKLTPQQRAFADAMQAYLSDTMAAKGNEVSLKKYGIRLFKKKDYFPIRVADQFMAKAREQQSGDRKLKDSGFTKDRKPEAKNPVVLSGFTEIWAEHVDEMSLYHSFVLPLDDFNRVLNYHDAFVEGEQAASVVEAITNAFGKGAVNYIDQLIKDVNGGIKGGSTVSFANSLMSKAKKGQTMASLSVAIQQPSSIIRAMSEVDSKYFIGPKVTEKTHDRIWDEIKKHAPVAIIKEMGGYDTNVGKSTVDYLTDTAEYNGFGEKFKALFTDEKFRDDALGRLPALMDEMAWGVIWNAVKREQSDKHPNMDVKSDAFMKLVANRFTEVITRTQVYDSVFSRSGLMRDRKSDLAKMVTSFMAEPTTTANMLAVSILQASRGDIKGKQVAKTVGSIVASLALNAALVSTIYAMRDDDEDKRYDEKWIENFYSNFFESLNPLGYIPYVRDIYNLFAKGYDVERSDMELFGDLQNAIDGLDNDDLTAWEKTENVIGAMGNLLGIPLKNIIRDGKGVAKTIAIAMDEESKDSKTKTGRYMARRGLDLNDGEEALLAIQRGDSEHIQRVFGRYESQEEAERVLQSAIREKYKTGDLTREEAEELLTVNFDRDDNDEVYWLLDEWDYAKENGSSDGYAKYGKLYEAIENGGDYTAEMDRLTEHGSEASEIRSQITRKYHKQYLEGDEATQKDIRDKITPVLESAGLDESEIEEKFSSWDFEVEYGMTYSEFKTEYRDGNVTEAEMRGAMKFTGMLNYEIEESIRSLKDEIKFVNKYDMTLSEMKDAYDSGDITRNQMTNALVFSGMSQSEAEKWVTERDIEIRLGIDYAKLDDAYKHNDISRQTLYNAMIEHGATKQEADDAILGYDWLKKNVKKYPDMAISDAKKFAVRISTNAPDYTLEDFGVRVDDYIQYSKLRPDCKGVDNNGDGQADSGTKRDAIFKMIDSLPISSDAKDGLALIDYGMKSIRKNAPWH